MEGLGVPVYLLHPMVVHFPIAVLVLGFAAGLASRLRRAPGWLAESLPWILGTGTLFLWLTLGLGLVAERTAPHVPAAWRVMADHKEHAWITAAAFSLLCLAWALARGRWRLWLLGGWALALTQLALTAHLGAQLVYVYGLGSVQP